MDGTVYALAFDGSGNLYAGGRFGTAGGVAANYIAKWDGSTWSALGTGVTGNYSGVNALAFDGSGNLYVGGDFTTAGGKASTHLAKWLAPDSDSDGVPDDSDAFPNDPTEQLDTDGDGIGNNADHDDDGDGTPDVIDLDPLNPAVNEIGLPLDGNYKGSTIKDSAAPL